MWQVLLAAAIAGSTGLVAKHFLSPTSPDPGPQWEQPIDSGGYDESNFEQGVFRFSSSASAGKRIRRNKSGTPSPPRRAKCVERSGGGGGGRRFAVRLKKRRKIAAKCGSPRSSSKDINLLGRGVGIGMMYMMSAGKAEISRLSAAMDETYKAVQELKTELYKRKSTQLAPGPKAIIDDPTPLLHNQSSLEDRQLTSTKISGLPVVEDADCPSSVLTEEPEHEALEMDRLEAELESELQKLPWSTVEASGNEVRRPTLGKIEIASEGFHVLEGQTAAVSYQSQGVSPSELDQKLCHLLIEQQENQIVGLESELNLAQAKILEKETELQALKDCVRRLTQFSLSTVSDDEAEQQTEQGCNSEWNSDSMAGFESRKSVVGMKRPIDSA